MVIRRLEEITIGERRRVDAGDIAGLAVSLKRYGLLHPIVIDGDDRLVVGGRRLQAARVLGWEEIEVRVLSELSEEELREIELEENEQRKALTDAERSKVMVRKAGRVGPLISANLAEKAPQGRKSIYEAPRADIAAAIGTTESSLRRAEQHVAAVERYPELEPLSQQAAIEASKAMNRLKEVERAETRAALDGLPPEERRRLTKERIKAEQETGAAIMTFVGDPEGKIARATLRYEFSKAREKARRLLELDAEELAGLFDNDDWDRVKRFAHDLRAWLDKLEQSRPTGPRLVKGAE